MASASSSVPRNFKLLDELADAEKGTGDGGADISLGLMRPDDTYMNDWQATIFQACGGGAELRLWTVTLVCDARYPSTPPKIKFVDKISMDCVDASGLVAASKVPYLASWSSSSTMLGALQAIKQLMARAPRGQPAEGTRF